mmetsp:Transcript_77004/g.121590  ORF Transcript_77004/g.121590 Transcript_77004/m.121590 type:complete len:122 (+) Transcript_77004:42-407(+)
MIEVYIFETLFALICGAAFVHILSGLNYSTLRHAFNAQMACLESLLKHYSSHQWMLLVVQVVTVMTSFITVARVASAPEDTAGDFSLDDYCKVPPKIYMCSLVFISGALLNCKALFAMPVL